MKPPFSLLLVCGRLIEEAVGVLLKLDLIIPLLIFHFCQSIGIIPESVFVIYHGV